MVRRSKCDVNHINVLPTIGTLYSYLFPNILFITIFKIEYLIITTYKTYKKQNQIILLKHALVLLPDSIIINKKCNTLTISHDDMILSCKGKVQFKTISIK